MNHSYRLVFNKALGVIQVVSEIAHSQGKKSAGKSSESQAHIALSRNASAPFKLKAISIASAITVSYLLIIASPSFALAIDGSNGTSSGGAGGVGVDGGGNGGAGGAGYRSGSGGGGGGGNTSSGAGGNPSYGGSVSGGGGGLAGEGGTAGTNGYNSGGGGGGGGVGLFINGSSPLINSAPIHAGNGGAGGASAYGAGGNGGDGGSGVYGNGFSLTNSSSIFGGAGGVGGHSNDGDGGSGGNGGAGVSGSNFSLTNSGTIIGGNGGNLGGTGGGIASLRGSGGNGGAGVSGSNFSLTNSGAITGGNGGAGGLNNVSGASGAGVEVISGSGTTITNSSGGTISGGSGPAVGEYGVQGGAGANGILIDPASSNTTIKNYAGAFIRGGVGGGGGGGSNKPAGGAGGAGISNVGDGTIQIDNSGSITGAAGGRASIYTGGAGGAGISNAGSGTTIITNHSGAVITGGAGGYGYGYSGAYPLPGVGGGAGGLGISIAGSGTTTIINELGATISGGAGGFCTYNFPDGGGAGVSGTGFTLTNSGTITGGVGGDGGFNANSYGALLASGAPGGAGVSGSGFSLTNSGTISGGNGGGSHYANGGNGGAGVHVLSGSGATITNSLGGTIAGGSGGTGGTGVSGGNGIQVDSGGSISTLTNNGSIFGGIGAFGILNNGSITTLNNLQGASGGALTLSGTLPTNYNIIINSPTDYGQLSVTSATGTVAFGIHSTSIVGAAYTYLDVLKGFTDLTNVTGTTGTYNGYSYSLIADSGNVGWWNLVFALAGPSAFDTQASLHSLAPKLRSGFNSQAIATNFANMNTYDCDLFDSNGVCVSVGGQQTYVDNPSSNMTSTVVVAGYKVSPQVRIGGFLNQNINNNTVSSVHISNSNPLMGLFAVWNQNEDHLGYQVKIANAYQDKDVTTTREVIRSSQAGTGNTTLNTQSYVGELSYAFMANEDKTLVRPYAAIRYTRIKQDGYTESSSVSTPLTYAALEDRSTTALVGVKLNHKLAEKVILTGSLGIEQDIDHHVDNLTATGVSGLTSENFNDSIKRTRPVASIGAYYMPVKNQRISADVYYQQLPFQSTGAATAYVNYTIGF